MKIVTADQMRRLEHACIPLGVSLDDLMERAGLAVARCARSLLGWRRRASHRRTRRAGEQWRRRVCGSPSPAAVGSGGLRPCPWTAPPERPQAGACPARGNLPPRHYRRSLSPATTTRSCRLRLGDRRCAGNGTGASHGGTIARGDDSLAGCACLSSLLTSACTGPALGFGF